jgi:hypothetical protein
MRRVIAFDSYVAANHRETSTGTGICASNVRRRAPKQSFSQAGVTIGSEDEQVGPAPHGVAEDDLTDRGAVRCHTVHVDACAMPRQSQGDVGAWIAAADLLGARLHLCHCTRNEHLCPGVMAPSVLLISGRADIAPQCRPAAFSDIRRRFPPKIDVAACAGLRRRNVLRPRVGRSRGAVVTRTAAHSLIYQNLPESHQTSRGDRGALIIDIEAPW